MSGEEEDVKPSDIRLKTSKNVTIAFKLNGKNYLLLARLIAKAIWESLAVTYQSTSDPYLIYDLDDKVSRIVQGDMNLETYWRTLHGIWVEIDRCEERPIDYCDKGVCQYRNITNRRRLYKFLAGLNPQYEGIRRDILKESPTPSVDIAYGWVKREATGLKIMPSANPEPTGATNGDPSSGGVGFGFGARNTRLPPQSAPPRLGQQTPRPAAANNSRGGNKQDKSKLWCSHCGMSKHTREICFQLVGFPEWWDENQKGKAKLAIGLKMVELVEQEPTPMEGARMEMPHTAAVAGGVRT